MSRVWPCGVDVSADYAVTSPSFTLINEYPGRLKLFHIDLYRLGTEADLDDLGLSEMLHGEGVAAVEWADKLTDGAAAERLEIRFEFGDDDRRRLRMVAYWTSVPDSAKSAAFMKSSRLRLSSNGGVRWD